MATKEKLHSVAVDEDLRSVPYSEDVDLLIGKGFSEKELQIIDYKLGTHRKDTKSKKRIRARYTVEVMFGSGYSLQQPSGGMMVYWENGALDGDGQGSVYLCPGVKCGRPLPAGGVGGEWVYCPLCDSKWKVAEIDGGRFVKQDVQGWAKALLKVIQRLGFNADIRLIYTRDDLRSAVMLEQELPQEGERIGDVRRGRAMRVYWLHDIVKDTSTGTSLESRVLAFLKA